MKRFKIGFLTVVAIAAMSFTVVSKESKPSAGKTKYVVADCVKLQVFNPENCTFFTPIQCADAVVGRAVRSISANTDPLCGTGNDIFCCATLAPTDVQSCSQQPTLNFTDCNDQSQLAKRAIICAVLCKPNN